LASRFRCHTAAVRPDYQKELLKHSADRQRMKADSFYAPIVALAVSLQGPASPRALSHLTI